MRFQTPSHARILAAVVVTAATATLTSAVAEPQAGWTLYSGLASTQSYLVDLDGVNVKTWDHSFTPGVSFYLREEGSILRPANDFSLPGPSGGGVGGRLQKFAWDNTLEWDYVIASPDIRQHHDVAFLPNGNILSIAWESIPAAEAIALGRDPATVGTEVWGEVIYELVPTGPTTADIVWEWSAFDHLVQDFDPALPNFGDPADHPERIDINFIPNGASADWLHFNAIDYNAQLDQIIVSCHAFDEIWIFSHDEADSGDLLYRWGNPRAWGMGTAADQVLFNQHNAQWIASGLPGENNILLYNNGVGRPMPAFSTVDELEMPLNPDGTYHREAGQPFGPDMPVWTCDNAGGDSFFSSFISGAQRLPNGNTLVCVGASGEFKEIAPDCSLEWEFSPGGAQFRATRIGIRDPRLRDLLWCGSDIAAPYGVFDLADVQLFVTGFVGGDPIADMDSNGIFDLSDVQRFITTFVNECD